MKTIHRHCLLALLMLLVSVSALAQYNALKVRVTNDEKKLYDLIMEYRASKGLSRIPLSPALCYVAQTHARDSYNHWDEIPKGCNAHSWSSHGQWSKCDYYSDHRNAKRMWVKPQELTDYKGYGYENAMYCVPPTSGTLTPEQTLQGWKGSPGHNAVIVNSGIWADHEWHAIGVGMYKGIAYMWVGEEYDKYTFDN